MSGCSESSATSIAPRLPFWLMTSPVVLKILRKDTAPVELRATLFTRLSLGRRPLMFTPMPPP